MAWHNDNFPFELQDAPYNVAARVKLFQVRDIEWYDNTKIRPDRGDQTLYLRPDPSSEEMANLLGSCTILEAMTLVSRQKVFEDTLWTSLLNMPHLRWLIIDLPAAAVPFPLVQLYPLLERLYGLELGGQWYQREQGHQVHLAPWAVRVLKVAKDDLHLLRYSRNLRVLTLKPNQDASLETFSLSPIMACHGLKKITVSETSRLQRMTDVEESILSCKHLEGIQMNVGNQEQASFLKRLEGKDQRGLVLPELEHVSIKFLSVETVLDPELHKAVRSLLRTRPLLKALSIKNAAINPFEFFVGGSQEALTHWQCLGLRWLRLELAFPPLTQLDKGHTWRTMYRQLSRLTRLRWLKLQGQGCEIDITLAGGITQLAGSTGLRRLSLIDNMRREWSTADIRNILQAVPNLHRLDLFPIANNNRSIIKAAIRNSTKPDVRVFLNDTRII
ncbi:hypothetical protein BGX33_000407 [Mortierella sp. NVP41]|nr:hypothetical protein BGX33_000407 [Mortierella sp. NVP41]